MNVLDGIKVVDVTVWAFGPAAAGVLAHWGADVIKIEHPRNFDQLRLVGGGAGPGGAGVMFRHYNRGKRAMTLDLRSEEGHEVLGRLVRDADVFMTSFLTDTRKKLRVDVDDIRAINPQIVYAKGTGQGPKGPDAERGGYDLATYWSRGGLADTAAKGAGVDRPPPMVGHGDGLAGFMLASGICAALLHRERTGVAQVVDASLLGAAMWVLGPVLASAQFEDSVVAPTPRESMGPGMIAYRTKDGRFVQLVMLGGRDDFRDLCEHIGHPELEADPRFADVQFSPADVGTSRAEAVQVLDEIFAQRTLAEWRTALATMRGVWAPVQTMAELYEDSQTVANGFIQEVPGAPDGLKLPVPPVLFDGEGGAPPRAPDFGEHTNQILAEAGYNAAEIEAMRSAEVI